MIVRELVAMFGFKVDQQSATKVEGAISKLTDFAKTAASAFAVGAIVNQVAKAVSEVTSLGDELAAMSQRLGVSVKDLQEFGFAAEMANVPLDAMAVSMRFLSKNAYEAATGNKEAAAAFQAIKVNATDAQGKVKPVSELILEISDRFQGIDDPAKKTVLAMKLLGRAGADLIPFLSQGSDEIRNQTAELSELGGLMSDELVGASDGFSDSMVKMNRVFLGIKISITRALLPAIQRITDATIKFFKANGDAIRENILSFFSKLAGLLEAVAKVFMGAAQWAANLDSTQKTILAITGAVILLAVALLSPVFAFVLLGIVIAAAIEDFQRWQEGGDSAIGRIIGGLKLLGAEFPGLTEAAGGFFDWFTNNLLFIRDILYVIAKSIGAIFGANTGKVIGENFDQLFEADWARRNPEEAKAFYGKQAGAFRMVGQISPEIFRPPVEAAAKLKTSEDIAAEEQREIFRVAENRRVLGEKIKGVLGSLSEFAFGGYAGAAISGAKTVAPTNTIHISVTGTNMSSPDDVAVSIAEQVKEVLTNSHREALDAMSVAPISSQ